MLVDNETTTRARAPARVCTNAIAHKARNSRVSSDPASYIPHTTRVLPTREITPGDLRKKDHCDSLFLRALLRVDFSLSSRRGYLPTRVTIYANLSIKTNDTY